MNSGGGGGGGVMEIKARLGAANKCCFSLMKHLSSKLLSHKIKCLIYRTLISPALTHGSESRAMGKQGENLRRSLERNLIQKILGLLL